MRRTTSLAVVFMMTLALSAPVFGGDMPGPGAPQKPPHGGHSMSAQSAIGAPLEGQGVEIQRGADDSEATPDPIDQAMIFAIQLVISLF